VRFRYPGGITDHDLYDLRIYLESSDLKEVEAAARRMDRRAVANGQMSPEDYRNLWNETYRP
jgi:hypothetical protein